VHVGDLVVDIRHAGRVDMLLPGTLAGLVITARELNAAPADISFLLNSHRRMRTLTSAFCSTRTDE